MCQIHSFISPDFVGALRSGGAAVSNAHENNY